MECNPQGGDEDFMRNDDVINVIRAAVAALSPCHNKGLLGRSVMEQTEHSKIALESGCSNIEDIAEDNSIFESFAARGNTPRGATAQHLSKVWRISIEDAKWTIETTS